MRPVTRIRCAAGLLAGLALLTACEDDREWRLGFGGDTVLARGIEKMTRMRKDPAVAFGNMVPALRELDLLFCNLEGQISDVGAPIMGGKKEYYFRAGSDMVHTLTAIGVDAVTIANNHGMDFGPDALLETLSLCRDSGIAIVGGGRDLEEASAPGVVEAAGRRVAFVGMNATYPQMKPTDGAPGLNSYNLSPAKLILDSARQSFERASETADVVLFTIHWGPNYGAEPTAAIRKLGRDLLDVGYDAVLGHSAHQFHGVEVHEGKPIIYDAGNFAVDFVKREWNYRNILFVLHFRGDRIDHVEGIPTLRVGSVTNFAVGAPAREATRRLAQLSSKLGTKAIQTSDQRVIVRMDQQ